MSADEETQILGRMVKEKAAIQHSMTALYEEIGRIANALWVMSSPLRLPTLYGIDSQTRKDCLKNVNLAIQAHEIEQLGKHLEAFNANIERLSQIDASFKQGSWSA